MSTMPGSVEAEDDAALQGRGRVVEMHDRAPGAADRLEGALDQLGARLGQHLDRDVVGDQVLLDELADEIEIGLRRGREADLDLLEAELAPAGRTCGACARAPSARPAPGCRRADRRCTRSARVSMTRDGQRRSGKWIGANGRYLWIGISDIVISCCGMAAVFGRPRNSTKKRPYGRRKSVSTAGRR